MLAEKLVVRNRLRHLAAAVCLAATLVLAHGAAWAETAKVTFILMNDIYQMGETAEARRQSRGGFARLAAVVKAERERARSLGGHVVLAHGGDTLSPSLMSGIDQGAHIMVLTNMLKPDIFAPGNHEFDFGKAVFIKRMGEANFRASPPTCGRPTTSRSRASRIARSSRWTASASG